MRRHISPALVISIIALIGAWGGPAVAKVLIDSGDIKDRSIRGRDIGSGTVTGRNVTALRGRDVVTDSLDGSDIEESTLRGIRAASADSADEIEGVSFEPFEYADPSGKSKVFYEEAGLLVEGFCNSGTLEAVARATVSDAIVRNSITTAGGPPVVAADNDFDAGETVNLVPAGVADASGALTFFDKGGGSVIVQYLAASQLPESAGTQCLLSGVAIRRDG